MGVASEALVEASVEASAVVEEEEIRVVPVHVSAVEVVTVAAHALAAALVIAEDDLVLVHEAVIAERTQFLFDGSPSARLDLM